MERMERYESRPPALMNAMIMIVLSCVIGLTIAAFVLPPTTWRMDSAAPVNGFELWAMLASKGPRQLISATTFGES